MGPAPLVLVLLLGSGLAGCRGEGAVGDTFPGSVEVSVAPTPPVVGPALVIVRVRGHEGDPVIDADVRLEGTMTHAGMVPVHADAVESGAGNYRVDAFEFTMGGDWILRAHIETPDGPSGVHETNLRVVSGPRGDGKTP